VTRTLITPDEIARALETYLATGSFRAAAAAIDRDRMAVTRALKRHTDSGIRAQVYARKLDSILDAATAGQREAIAVLRRDVRSSDPKVAHSAAASINDTARTASVARTAHAKLTGDHAADKIDLDLSADDDLARRLAGLVAATGRDPGESDTR
jgi:hypothetical protein